MRLEGGRRRSAMFAESDISNAAADFIEALSEHAEVLWDQDAKDALIESLTARSFVILRDDGAQF